MGRQPLRPLVLTALALALVVPVLLTGGFIVRGYIRASFHREEEIRSARALAFTSLRLQLDEETGMRGFEATHDRLYLEPYYNARRALPQTLASMHAAVGALGLVDAATAARDQIVANAAWERNVAQPLIARSAVVPEVVQRRGKMLIDRYRLDNQTIQDALLHREARIDAETQTSIDRIQGFGLLTVLILGLVGLGFGLQQVRTARRLAMHEREAVEMRSAFEAEKRIADTLQEAFVLKALPALSGVTFSATYVPATDEANVGGDWYDGVQLSRDRVLFVIGDVAGHGLDAAVAMNQARQELISAAAFDPDPGELLVRVNAELLRQHTRMVTVACGYADLRTFEFAYATAGHPPPLLVEPGRAPRMLQFGGLPLAVLDGATYRTLRVQTVPGAVLVLYTDGAIEHSRDVLAGESLLLETVGRAVAGGVTDIAGAVRDAIFKDRPVADDVAIMTVAFAPVDPGDPRAAGTTTGLRRTIS
ncbi:MAG TPA: SpoIIE family protein phosphatase [Candidatus Elarobacter sp.]|jgi:CHASE3 domain sensor protein|nr:SpoIIE family protein phosphatase [Candidatus Elarobacter sp.]